MPIWCSHALTKPNQDLRRDLQSLASDLKWSAFDLMRIAERLRRAGNEHQAQEIIRIRWVAPAQTAWKNPNSFSKWQHGLLPLATNKVISQASHSSGKTL
ncbi:hypothetical protein ACYST8_13685 [Pseudomonas inefficax]